MLLGIQLVHMILHLRAHRTTQVNMHGLAVGQRGLSCIKIQHCVCLLPCHQLADILRCMLKKAEMSMLMEGMSCSLLESGRPEASHVTENSYSQTTSENIATCRRRHVLISSSSTSNTSHCLALKKVDGPTGGPKAGDTTSLRFPPTFIVLIPFSKPTNHKTSN